MPTPIKPSLMLYEKLGEEVVNELGEWFNQVDAAYRTQLKELNEANFARLDAKLEQRSAEIKGELRAEMHAGFARLEKSVAGVQAELIKWTFLFWLGAIGIVLLLNRS